MLSNFTSHAPHTLYMKPEKGSWDMIFCVPSPIFIMSTLIICSVEPIIQSNYFIYLRRKKIYSKNFPN